MFLEHVNMTVHDLDRSIAFYQALLGLRVRWRGVNANGQPAAHIGDDRNYLALFQASHEPQDGSIGEPDYDRIDLNHFGWVVDDLDAARERLAALQIQPHYEPNYAPGRRLYFYDPDGFEVELVNYDPKP